MCVENMEWLSSFHLTAKIPIEWKLTDTCNEKWVYIAIRERAHDPCVYIYVYV